MVKKGAQCFRVKVDVQKGTLRFKGKIDKRCVCFVQFMFSSIVAVYMIIVLNDYHLHLFIFVRVCIWVLGFYKLKALGHHRLP
jgi:hypothetical protein